MIVDAHHHFWKYNSTEYDWIDDTMKSIRKDFLPDDLEKTIVTAGVDAVVSIQARQSIEETEWLLQLADKNDFIKGVVGWLPIMHADFSLYLEKFKVNKKLVGLRHVIQGEPDDKFILGNMFNRGIEQISDTGLVYDILVFERHLPYVVEFVKRHPGQVFVIDHIAKPQIKKGLLSPWKEHMQCLGKFDNVYCKISGMVTEADFRNWKEADLSPYFNVLLDSFSPERLMFGSDWPVCLVGVEYQRWMQIVKKHIDSLSKDEQNSIMGGNAIEAYQLKF